MTVLKMYVGNKLLDKVCLDIDDRYMQLETPAEREAYHKLIAQEMWTKNYDQHIWRIYHKLEFYVVHESKMNTRRFQWTNAAIVEELLNQLDKNDYAEF